MSKNIALILFVICFFSCKKKETTTPKTQTEKQMSPSISKFENQLLDYRLEIGSFNVDYKFIKFGVKANDNLSHSFVLKLHPETKNEVVESYSIGVRAYSSDLEKPISFDVNPKITIKDDDKYLVINKKIPVNIRYFDSVLMFIYEKNNWKNSGSLGMYKIQDILFEDKE